MEHEPIDRKGQELFLKRLLTKYKDEIPNLALKVKIWDELALEKHLGRLKIPFKIILRKDPDHLFPDIIEVLLDSKV